MYEGGNECQCFQFIPTDLEPVSREEFIEALGIFDAKELALMYYELSKTANKYEKVARRLLSQKRHYLRRTAGMEELTHLTPGLWPPSKEWGENTFFLWTIAQAEMKKKIVDHILKSEGGWAKRTWLVDEIDEL